MSHLSDVVRRTSYSIGPTDPLDCDQMVYDALLRARVATSDVMVRRRNAGKAMGQSERAGEFSTALRRAISAMAPIGHPARNYLQGVGGIENWIDNCEPQRFAKWESKTNWHFACILPGGKEWTMTADKTFAMASRALTTGQEAHAQVLEVEGLLDQIGRDIGGAKLSLSGADLTIRQGEQVVTDLAKLAEDLAAA